jgi:hypothetical protein
MIELLLSVVLSQVAVDTSCPVGTHFVEGRGCAANVAEPACPPGTRFNGSKCTALVDTSCPAGMAFVEGKGCVQNASRAATRPQGTGTAAASAGYTHEEILSMVSSLGAKRDMSKTKLQDLSRSVSRSMESAEFKKLTATRSVRGVLVFQGGEGGLVVKFMSGQGFVSIKGGRQGGRVSVRSWSAGAQIGGSAMWGAALVLGLEREADLGGDYKGRNAGATAAGESSQSWLRLTQEGKPQVLWVAVAGRGLSASAGGQKLTVTPEW